MGVPSAHLAGWGALSLTPRGLATGLMLSAEGTPTGPSYDTGQFSDQGESA